MFSPRHYSIWRNQHEAGGKQSSTRWKSEDVSEIGIVSQEKYQHKAGRKISTLKMDTASPKRWFIFTGLHGYENLKSYNLFVLLICSAFLLIWSV
jgi:hypothetical protein